MALIAFNNIPYGSTFQPGKPEQIVSDGKVEDRFAQQDPEFITDITDARVQSFCHEGTAPGESWTPHPLGGFDSENQSIFIENERVVLRSNGEDGKRHLVNAPFNKDSGMVELKESTEGFDTAPKTKKKESTTFTLPASFGENVEFAGVFNLDDVTDPNTMGIIFGK